MSKPINVKRGTRFGRWKVLRSELRFDKRQNNTFCQCACSCGAKRWIMLHSLRQGKSKGCNACGRKKLVKEGRRFGRLTVLRSFLGPKTRKSASNQTYCECRCLCGQQYIVRLASLESGDTRSCQCLKREAHHKRVFKHGLSRTSEYYTWHQMIKRCTDPTHPRWKDYGGRGINVCVRWQKSFLAFLKDMGRRPSPELSLDRWDNNGNYEPSNCQWVTYSYQNKNRRNFALPNH